MHSSNDNNNNAVIHIGRHVFICKKCMSDAYCNNSHFFVYLTLMIHRLLIYVQIM